MKSKYIRLAKEIADVVLSLSGTVFFGLAAISYNIEGRDAQNGIVSLFKGISSKNYVGLAFAWFVATAFFAKLLISCYETYNTVSNSFTY